MLTQTILFLLLFIVFLLLLAINVVFLLRTNKNDKKINELLENGQIKDLKSILLSQKRRDDKLDEEIKEALEKIKNLENTSLSAFQKIGVVRFNPFSNLGGNQSFVIALLDNENNGFLISSLFVKDGNRVYAKIINQGKSDYPLSKEEVEALSCAMKIKR